jgi:hypothetical protein
MMAAVPPAPLTPSIGVLGWSPGPLPQSHTQGTLPSPPGGVAPRSLISGLLVTDTRAGEDAFHHGKRSGLCHLRLAPPPR